MSAFRICLLALFSLLVTQPVFAQGNLVPLPLIDPLDGSEFEAVRPLSTNGQGGYDSDFCPYSSGSQPREFAIATSPTTLFSADLGDFEVMVTDEQAARLREALDSLRDGFPEPHNIPPWERHQLAGICYQVLGASPAFLGDLYLQAAWTARDRVVGFIPGIAGPASTFGLLVELAGRFEQFDQQLHYEMGFMDLARLAHRGGFRGLRDAIFARYDEYPRITEQARERRAMMLHYSEIEDRYLTLAKEQFQHATSDAEGAELSRLIYLIADIDRRLGDEDAARRGLLRLETRDEVDGRIVTHINELRQILEQQAHFDVPPAGPTAAQREAAGG